MVSAHDGAATTFDERCELLEDALTRQSLHREVLYKTLALCQERRELSAVEAAMAAFPEFAEATQSQYHLISVLVDAGGLARFLLDEAGDPIDPDAFEGLSEDEADDLVFGEAYETTEVGCMLVRRHDPRARLAELMEREPHRAAVYRDLLSMCAERPRTYGEIDQVLRGSEALVREEDGRRSVMQPSVLVDRLQRAAGLVWQNAWKTTPEGKEYLERNDEKGVTDGSKRSGGQR